MQDAADLGGIGLAPQLLAHRQGATARAVENPVVVGVDGEGQPGGRGDLAEQEEIALGVLAPAKDASQHGPGRIIDGAQQHAGWPGRPPGGGARSWGGRARGLPVRRGAR